ncbi:receptor-type tyrosine-protein phosphatase N2 isoform X1 [Cyprinodon tularosa]|uniref:receptor-type tyrosine-protein phosphatase N2 isoform X1 n=1 Tax=Cyprinodon tularosa TaxID=77115 RepID=UPI0018E1DE48|nr:receptor-type tyrosine-protein phosphatase N2 isoform X1 [Cyprinodon tularosa]
MDSPWRPVLIAALAVCFCSSPAASDRKFGCLFEDKLCAPYEFCINDGVFGRCQELAGADLYTYDISSSALQRLRILLQKLAHRGLTWQDDITQQVISRELSKLRTIPLRQQSPPLSHLMAYSNPRNRKPSLTQTELSRNLQAYLTGLGFMPQADTNGNQPVNQNQDITPDAPKKTSQLKPNQGWKETTIYSLQKGAGQPPVTKVITKSGDGRHPKLSTGYSSHEPDRSKLLSNHVQQLLPGASGTQQGFTGGEPVWPKGKLHYLSYLQPAQSNRADPQIAFGSNPAKPNLDRLLFKAGSNQLLSKSPHSVMDDHLILNTVNHLGSHSLNMEALMGKDLDQLAEVITGALQEVDEERLTDGAGPVPGAGNSRGEMRVNKQPPSGSLLNQDQDLKLPELNPKGALKLKQGQRIDGADKESTDKHTAIFSKLLDYLNMEPFGDAPGVKSGPRAPLQKMVGLESVHSITKQGQVPAPFRSEEKIVTVPAKEGSTLRLSGGVEGPEGRVDSEIQRWMQGDQKPVTVVQPEEAQKKDVKIKTQLVHVGLKEFSSRGKDRHFGYIITNSDSLTNDRASDLMERLTQRLNLHAADLTQLSVLGPALTFRVGPNPKNVTTADLVQVAVQEKLQLEKETGLKIVEAGVSDRGSLTQIPVVKETRVESGQFLLLSVLCMLFILVALTVSATFFCVRQRSHLHMKEKLASLGTDTNHDATTAYQELCRQRMAIRTSERVERPETLRHSRLNSVSSQFSDGPAASPSTRSSTSSWCEEPVPSNMDISTGHMILSYMEDHLKNKNRLEREWEALCSYQAEPSACSVGQIEQNSKKNRANAVVVYDHSRITLKAENNHSNSDYINASPIMDHDPRNPTYIAAQGPLASTVADFWQMVWESGCVVIVMLTPLSENGVKQCHHYWPDEGSDIYHIYEVNLVSEHIWCEDFLVRSFYLKNLQTNETRTVTQFHFLSWMDRGIPSSARTLLDFRRKVNKCYRGRSCPIIVHCSDGAGRSGTYMLIDMVLNRMAKGAKEIDIAATLEHLRDQRAGMVQTKEQFEFALTAVAEEVNAILKALPQ